MINIGVKMIRYRVKHLSFADVHVKMVMYDDLAVCCTYVTEGQIYTGLLIRATPEGSMFKSIGDPFHNV